MSPRRRSCLDCSKPMPRNDKHACCYACRRQRRKPDARRRADIAAAVFPQTARAELLHRVTAGNT